MDERADPTLDPDWPRSEEEFIAWMRSVPVKITPAVPGVTLPEEPEFAFTELPRRRSFAQLRRRIGDFFSLTRRKRAYREADAPVR